MPPSIDHEISLPLCPTQDEHPLPLRPFNDGGILAECPKGRKDDQGKLRWDLLPWDAVKEIARVLMHGSQRYGDNNWKHVPEAHNRYFSAAMRHIVAWQLGETHDPDTHLPHLAHACCCLLFLLWFSKTAKEMRMANELTGRLIQMAIEKRLPLQTLLEQGHAMIVAASIAKDPAAFDDIIEITVQLPSRYLIDYSRL